MFRQYIPSLAPSADNWDNLSSRRPLSPKTEIVIYGAVVPPQSQVYLRLFRWLVKRVNASTCLPPSEERQDAVFVGLLDTQGYVKRGGKCFSFRVTVSA